MRSERRGVTELGGGFVGGGAGWGETEMERSSDSPKAQGLHAYS